jgi:hypothetical protein
MAGSFFMPSPQPATKKRGTVAAPRSNILQPSLSYCLCQIVFEVVDVFNTYAEADE